MTASKFIDRELSWMEFNVRVLNEALDVRVPLLERVKFLAITASNLDEFFRVRMAAMRLVQRSGETSANNAGLTVGAQIDAVRTRIQDMVEQQYNCLRNEILPKLEQQGIRRLLMSSLNTGQQRFVRQIVDRELISVHTPMPVALDDPFPILGQGLNIFVRVRSGRHTTTESETALTAAGAGEHACHPLAVDGSSSQHLDWMAVIPVSKVLSRFLNVPGEAGTNFLLLEEVLCHHIQAFFPGDTVIEAVPFRITRSAEVEVQEYSPAGLAWEMEEVLAERIEAECIRLEIDAAASAETLEFLQQALELNDRDVYALSGPLDLGAIMELAVRPGLGRLRYDPWPPVHSPDAPAEELLFDVLSERDVLLLHPYESFEPVVRLVEQAAEDPDVLAIKQTLYRVSRDSQIIQALIRAVENGKHVTALVELKARFDEARNLKQARDLERAGAQVIWGVKGLKTHAKLCIVVRREPQGLQRYVHFGTGNYNESTALTYTDVSLLTSNDDLGADAVAFFNTIAAYSQPQKYRKLEAAPLRLRETLCEMIRGETRRKRAKRPARIIAKLNALVDPELIEALYEASQAGVDVKLNVRGICCLRPGVPGLSDNIEVVSVVDRFLEHARIIAFLHDGNHRVFISSADWMQRNLDHRKELLIPIEDTGCAQRLLSVLAAYFKDNQKSWRLRTDGSYERRSPAADEPPYRVQEQLYQDVGRYVRSRIQKRRTTFEPHRPD